MANPLNSAFRNALDVLGLSLIGLSERSVLCAYKKLVKKAHPDRGGSSESFMLLESSRKIVLDELASIAKKSEEEMNARMVVYLKVTLASLLTDQKHSLTVSMKKRCAPCESCNFKGYVCQDVTGSVKVPRGALMNTPLCFEHAEKENFSPISLSLEIDYDNDQDCLGLTRSGPHLYAHC